MPKVAKELSASEVRRIDEPGTHAVGGCAGLLLKVSSGGGRSWILRARVGNRRRDFGLGGFPTVPLGDARNKARELRDKLAQGIDPVAERQAARAAHIASQAKRLTFREAAEQYHATKEKEFRNAKHRKDWIGSLKRYAFIHIGEVPVGDVELPHVLKALEPIWETKTETATRVRQRIEGVLAWAAVRGYRKGDNPARWQGNLDAVLAKPAKVGKGKRHFPALPWQRVPEFLQDLRTREGMGARALEFAILTAARSGEIRGATWDEIDLSAKVWTIPADRMKAGKPHRIPLSSAAVTLLEALPRMQSQSLIFPAVRGGKISDVTILATVKRMNATKEKEGGEQYTDPTDGRPVVPHGFRSAFKDWARNRSSYPDEVSELALAHVNSDATRAAYARDELLPQRTKLMTAWAGFCEEPAKASASVTAIRGEVSA
ncbi:tyrosine-type recombinase/integrase [Halomonas sp. AOP42-A1-14]|uniref:tyrosine-type recombinase/integrase n=1 Tax=Halomonas sp. AOP42-A1-14 TaxID=3457676 RepID=UPI004034C4C5